MIHLFFSSDLLKKGNPFTLVETLYCASKHFTKKFQASHYRIAIECLKRKVKAKACILVWYTGVNVCVEKDTLERQKEMWKNIGANITTQQKKLNQRDTCHVTSVTCLHGIFWCLLQKTKEQVRTRKRFLLQVQNHYRMNKWSWMFYSFFEMASHEEHF